jgi:uncharacterized Tic20 family protein
MTQPTLPDPPGLGPLSPSEERSWAMAAHLGVIVGAALAMAFLAPLIVLLSVGNRSAFVRRHAIESLNFQLTLLICFAVAFVLGAVGLRAGFLLLVPFVGLGGALALVAVVLATLAASRGEEFRYPVTLRFIE